MVKRNFQNISITDNIAAVPEPATMALLGMGALVGTFVVRRRKA